MGQDTTYIPQILVGEPSLQDTGSVSAAPEKIESKAERAMNEAFAYVTGRIGFGQVRLQNYPSGDKEITAESVVTNQSGVYFASAVEHANGIRSLRWGLRTRADRSYPYEHLFYIERDGVPYKDEENGSAGYKFNVRVDNGDGSPDSEDLKDAFIKHFDRAI